MDQYNVPNILTLLTPIIVYFASSEYRWFWLVAGNRYIQFDGVRKAYILDEDGGLTMGRVRSGDNLQIVLKGDGMKTS